MQQLSARELADWLNDDTRPQPFLLDVRDSIEYRHCHIPGSVLMSMDTIPARVQDLPRDRDIVCICHHGGRSMQVAMFLAGSGFERIINLAGGVDAWSLTVDPAMPRY